MAIHNVEAPELGNVSRIVYFDETLPSAALMRGLMGDGDGMCFNAHFDVDLTADEWDFWVASLRNVGEELGDPKFAKAYVWADILIEATLAACRLNIGKFDKLFPTARWANIIRQFAPMPSQQREMFVRCLVNAETRADAFQQSPNPPKRRRRRCKRR